MKKSRLIVLIALSAIVFFGCKKTADPNSKQTTPPVVSSFSVDGITISNPTHSSFASGSNFGIIAYASSSNPEIQITFFGAAAPANGTYQITSGTLSYGQCQFVLADTVNNVQGNSPASTGVVVVETSGSAPKNKATFSNIPVYGAGGHHTVSGIITY